MNRFYLEVPYSQRVEVKRLGAKWEFDTKLWYTEVDHGPLAVWVMNPQPTAEELWAIMAKHQDKPTTEAQRAHWRIIEAQAPVYITKRTDFTLKVNPDSNAVPWRE